MYFFKTSKLSVYKIQLKIVCLQKLPGTVLKLKASCYITVSSICSLFY